MDWTYPILLLVQLLVAALLGAVATYLSVVLFDRARRASTSGRNSSAATSPWASSWGP